MGVYNIFTGYARSLLSIEGVRQLKIEFTHKGTSKNPTSTGDLIVKWPKYYDIAYYYP
jgi:hypothetical protein